jgi:hypothetical protein
MTVLGAFSAPVMRARQANKRRFVKALRRGQDDADPNDEGAIAVACAAVVAWSGVEAEGKPLPFSPESLKPFLVAAPWVVNQVMVAVDTPKLFSTSSSGS